MTGPTWTQPCQTLWLTERLSQYHDAQKRKAVGRFLKPMYEAWFRAFPLRKELFSNKPGTEALTAAENKELEAFYIVRKQQLKTWFSWRRLPYLDKKGGNASGRPGARRSGTGTIDELAQMLNINIEKKEGRAPQRIEAYQTLYNTRISDAIKQELALNTPPPGVPMSSYAMTVRRSVTQRMLQAETPDVHQKIDAYIADWKKNNAARLSSEGDEDDEDDEDAPPTPEEMQKVISKLPEFMERFFVPCSRASRWTFFIMAAGPTPAMGGKVYMETYNFGPKSPAGNTFSEAYVDFKQNVSTPFCKHAMGVFTSDICAASALKTHQTNAESLANAPSDDHHMALTTAASTTTAGTTTADGSSSEVSGASSTTSSTIVPTVSSGTAAGASHTDSGVLSTNDEFGAQLRHSINAIDANHGPMIGVSVDADQRSFNNPGAAGAPACVGPSMTLNGQAAGELGGGVGLLDWERDMLASMGDIDHTDMFGMDYMDSAFTDLPNASIPGTTHVNAPSMGHAPEFPSVQAMPPIPDLAQTGVYVDGFIFPNNNVIGLGQPTFTGSMHSHTDAHVTQITPGNAVAVVEPRVAAHVNHRVPGVGSTTMHVTNPTPTSAMGDISNNATQPKKGRGSKTKRKTQPDVGAAQPDVGAAGEPENVRRTKRKIVAPARRDKTPELGSRINKVIA